jgi:hypothetical protein
MKKTDFEVFQDPIYWFGNSERLKFSAELLKERLIVKPEIRSIDPSKEMNKKLALFESYMLLLGLSVENMIKGYALINFQLNNPSTSFRNLKELKNSAWGGNNGHELSKILASCGFEIYKAEKEFLERLETFIKWAGRYPIPQDRQKLEDAKRFNLRKSYSHDKDILAQLEYRLKTKYGR